VQSMRKLLVTMEANSDINSKNSSFKPRAETHAREVKSKHPWEFEYTRLENSTQIPDTSREHGTLYWQQACAVPRKDPKKAILDPKHARGKKIRACDMVKMGYTSSDKNRLFKQFNDPKLFHSLRRCWKALGGESNWKRMRAEFKKVAEVPRSTSLTNSIDVTSQNFRKVVSMFSLEGIDKSDLYMYSHAFRGMGMPEVVRVDEWYATMKIINEDDLDRNFDWEAEDRAKMQADIETMAYGCK